MGFSVGDQVNLALPLLGLKPVFGSAVMADAAAAQNDDDGPHQPEPWGVRQRGEHTVNTGLWGHTYHLGWHEFQLCPALKGLDCFGGHAGDNLIQTLLWSVAAAPPPAGSGER